MRLKRFTEAVEIDALLQSFYKHSPLVRLHSSPQLPQIQHVVRTNFCDLGFGIGPDRKRLLMVSSLDNLLKGAAGQAVQNMNLMCGWEEQEGLL
jgi:N-acetyl-gamma-glutamyl-phosphate reductase